MTLTDLKWPFHASRAISAVAELLVQYLLVVQDDSRFTVQTVRAVV